VTGFVTFGAGFLAAVLWMDLMFDIQVCGHREDELPEEVLTSITSYYRRATTKARPMNRLIALVMLTMVVMIIVWTVRDPGDWASWASLVLAGAPIGLAAARTVPNAVRLGARIDPPAHQSRLARSIYRDHLLCLAGIATLTAVQFR
jgi:hypothetical protein